MAGRKPTGPLLVHHLDGSGRAKERLEVILQTVAGEITIRAACDRLGIEEAMFYRLRAQALQAGLARLEPRPAGRPRRCPSPEDQRITELEQELQEKELQEKAMEARLEIAQAMAPPVEGAPKKTVKEKQRGKQLTKRRRRGKRQR